MKAVVSLAARMTSSRMPGKGLMPIEAGGETHAMLWYQVQRLRTAGPELVIATTWDDADDAIAAAAQAWDVRCVRGHPTDLLARHTDVARETDCDVFVLTGGDDPFIEPRTIDTVAWLVSDGFGYVQSEGYPIGMNAWGWTRRGLEEANAEATDPEEREHVNPWFQRRPDRYPPMTFGRTPSLYDRFRLTVDYPEDIALARLLMAELWPRDHDFGLDDVLAAFAAHPEWARINANRSTWHADLTPVRGVPV